MLYNYRGKKDIFGSLLATPLAQLLLHNSIQSTRKQICNPLIVPFANSSPTNTPLETLKPRSQPRQWPAAIPTTFFFHPRPTLTPPPRLHITVYTSNTLFNSPLLVCSTTSPYLSTQKIPSSDLQLNPILQPDTPKLTMSFLWSLWDCICAPCCDDLEEDQCCYSCCHS
jgi:hypothetical protein